MTHPPGLGAAAAAYPGVPRLRGRVHQVRAVAAVPAAVSIARLGTSPAARRAGGWYGAGLAGWSGVVVLPLLVGRLTAAQWALLLTGGVVTTAGAGVLVLRWPDPAPAVLGYHEVGHLVMLVGTVLHYALNRSFLAPR